MHETAAELHGLGKLPRSDDIMCRCRVQLAKRRADPGTQVPVVAASGDAVCRRLRGHRGRPRRFDPVAHLICLATADGPRWRPRHASLDAAKLDPADLDVIRTLIKGRRGAVAAAGTSWKRTGGPVYFGRRGCACALLDDGSPRPRCSIPLWTPTATCRRSPTRHGRRPVSPPRLTGADRTGPGGALRGSAAPEPHRAPGWTVLRFFAWKDTLDPYYIPRPGWAALARAPHRLIPPAPMIMELARDKKKTTVLTP